MHSYKITQQGAPLHQADKAVILIHGRGAPPEDILGLADFFDDGKTYFAAPEAEEYTWYPYSFMVPSAQNQPWLDSALENISTLVQNIEQHLQTEKIFIMGFSQGACLAAEVTARNARRYGGIGVFTGGLIGSAPDTSRYKGDFDQTKVFISNGDSDPHIPLTRTDETAKIMKKMGADLVKEIFPGRPHTINLEEINKVKEWFFTSQE